MTDGSAKAARARRASPLAVGLYMLAALAALAGVLALLGAFSAGAGLERGLAALGPLAGLLVDLARSAAQAVGLFVCLIMLGLGGLLWLAGRAVSSHASLAARVARLEAALGAQKRAEDA